MPVGATIAAVGSGVAQGVVGAQAAGKASKIGQQASAQAQKLAADVYATNKENLNPYIQTGTGATGALSAMLGVGGDQKAQEEAFNRYLGSTNYQFQLGQGLEAVKNAGAASFNSGATAKALGNYAQGQAGSALSGYQGMLGGLANQGMTAASNLGGIGTNYATQGTNAIYSGANAQIAGTMGQASNINNALGSISQGLTSFGNMGGFRGMGVQPVGTIAAGQSLPSPIASSFNSSGFVPASQMNFNPTLSGGI